MSEHSCVAKNMDLIRLFFKDLIEEEAVYKTTEARVMELSLAFDHQRFGSVSMLLQVRLNLDGSLVHFTGLDIHYANTSTDSQFMQTAQALRLGVHSHLNLAHGIVMDPSCTLLESPQVTHLVYRTMLQKEQVYTILTELLCYDVKLFANRYPPEILWKESFDQHFQNDHC